ncbi:MAG: hypothetical protein DRP01_06740 [Archaeoglobales archaeon]|nr:MAG: hypothetical protein DRP01_06740 [Archaeoglobales archaeon]
MREVKLYTVEDLKRDLDRGLRDGEVALKKWESILNALNAIEQVSIQITSFCLKYQKCEGCPILNYDYPCGHPYATFTIFYQELRKVRALAERLFAILKAIDEEEKYV